jgi:hypothetical protein
VNVPGNRIVDILGNRIVNTPGNWTVSVPDNRIVVIPDVACRLRVNSIVEKIDKIGSFPVNHFTESLDDNFGHFLGVLLFKTLKGKTMTNPCSEISCLNRSLKRYYLFSKTLE